MPKQTAGEPSISGLQLTAADIRRTGTAIAIVRSEMRAQG
jgi:hypothetical protein